MSDFKQIIRFENENYHKGRTIEYIKQLKITEDKEYIVTFKLYKQNKTLEQLGYYWGVIIPVMSSEIGLHKDDADQALKMQVLTPKYKVVFGENVEIRKSISKMKVNEMSKYIDDCINFLGVNGIAVPPPFYRV